MDKFDHNYGPTGNIKHFLSIASHNKNKNWNKIGNFSMTFQQLIVVCSLIRNRNKTATFVIELHWHFD